MTVMSLEHKQRAKHSFWYKTGFLARPTQGGETASKIGSSAAAFQPFCGQLENKRVQTPRDTCAEFGEACVAGSGRFRGNVG